MLKQLSWWLSETKRRKAATLQMAQLPMGRLLLPAAAELHRPSSEGSIKQKQHQQEQQRGEEASATAEAIVGMVVVVVLAKAAAAAAATTASTVGENPKDGRR